MRFTQVKEKSYNTTTEAIEKYRKNIKNQQHEFLPCKAMRAQNEIHSGKYYFHNFDNHYSGREITARKKKKKKLSKTL